MTAPASRGDTLTGAHGAHSQWLLNFQTWTQRRNMFYIDWGSHAPTYVHTHTYTFVCMYAYCVHSAVSEREFHDTLLLASTCSHWVFFTPVWSIC